MCMCMCSGMLHLLQLAQRLECRLTHPHVGVAPRGLGECGGGTQLKQLCHRLASHLGGVRPRGCVGLWLGREDWPQ